MNMKNNARISGVSESLDLIAKKGLTGKSNRVKRAELFVKGASTSGQDEKSFNFRVSRQ